MRIHKAIHRLLLLPRGGSPHLLLVIGGSLGMFSALSEVDGCRQRFGRLSPALSCKMCQCQCWFFIEQKQGSKKTKLKMY